MASFYYYIIIIFRNNVIFIFLVIVTSFPPQSGDFVIQVHVQIVHFPIEMGVEDGGVPLDLAYKLVHAPGPILERMNVANADRQAAPPVLYGQQLVGRVQLPGVPYGAYEPPLSGARNFR